MTIVRLSAYGEMIGTKVQAMLDALTGDPDRFGRHLDAIEAATSLDTLRLASRDLLEPYGLKHVVYHAIRIPAHDVVNQVMLFTYPADWVGHYVRRKYHLLDPVVRAAAIGILPVDWTRLDRSPPAVRRLFGEATEAGIGQHGLTIPIRGPSGDHAIFTVTSDVPAAEWDHVRLSYMRDMQIIGAYVHTRVVDLLGGSRDKGVISLSRREQETLQWAAAGKTIEDTATILSLSGSTVRVYLDSARHKLGCLSKSQAIAKAMRLGLLTA